MGWWYWFGVWIALALSIVLIWWSFLDAYHYGKRTGHRSKRMTLPSVSIVGLLLQVPALILTLTGNSGARFATAFAILGICGIIFVGVAMVTFFSQSTANDNAERTASGATHSRSEDTAAVSTTEDRHASGRAHTVRTNPGSSTSPTPLPTQDKAAKTPVPIAPQPAASDVAATINLTAAAPADKGATLHATDDKTAESTVDEPQGAKKTAAPQKKVDGANKDEAGLTRAYEMTADETVIDEDEEDK